MKTEGLSAEEATEIIQRGGVVEDKDGEKWADVDHTGVSPGSLHAPYRVVTPPPDAEPVVTAEELIETLLGWSNYTKTWLQDRVEDLKAARKSKPEPQPIRTLAEALAWDQLRLVDEDGREMVLPGGDNITKMWAIKALVMAHFDGYDKGRRVYDASEEEQAR